METKRELLIGLKDKSVSIGGGQSGLILSVSNESNIYLSKIVDVGEDLIKVI